MKNKLFFIDIDGTITKDNGIISSSTKSTLKEINNLYKNIILVSARPRNKVKDICDELKFRYFISSNGGEIYDNMNEKIVFSKVIKEKTVKYLANISLMYEIKLIVAIGNNEYEINNLNEDMYFKNVKQCMFKGENKKLNKLRKKLIVLDDIYVTSKTNQYENNYYWFSILPNFVSKGSSALHLANLLQIRKEDTIAIGNDFNDISMFEKLGKGVAVSNACEDLKKLATKIIGSNNEDGVKIYLEKILEK